MSINTQSMYNGFYQSEGVANSSRFLAAFIRATNDAIADMNTRAFKELVRIDALTDNIDLDADTYQSHLEMGIKRHIQESGEWSKDPDPLLVAKWGEALAMMRENVWNSDLDALWEGAHGYAQSDE